MPLGCLVVLPIRYLSNDTSALNCLSFFSAQVRPGQTRPMIMQRFLFPRWSNPFLLVLGAALGGGGLFAAVVGGLVTDPVTLNVGYQPVQPVPFSHAIHAGQLKLDCRYCHNTVFEAAHAAVPPTATCINCHSPRAIPGDETSQTALSSVQADSEKLKPIHESWKTGKSMQWKRVHNLPEFVYFNHSAHVNSGVSCKTCHGRVDEMDVVYQHEQLSMAWCISCHENPNEHLRPTEFVTKLDWEAPEGWDQEAFAKKVRAEKNIHPKRNCAVCHR